ncbi:hypothetical protein JTE90_018826 [Oedothorax gibbosus]|uniref:Vps72/YL1 C-terminal domain-containing protein n=1 Tax=Oedothorax gibbosus TaxID=931172 RepID=A0AAV6UY10_9ARAC|nr:hypothetical protein JTE90_018826 [Oedothorax gibbosus]
MGKKKRNSETAPESDTPNNPSTKEGTSVPVDLETPSEKTPIFKSHKFVQGKSTNKKSRAWKSLRQITTAEKLITSDVTYSTIDAPVSVKPPKKYSDLSGLEAKYTDPQTKMRFANADEFKLIRTLQPESVNAFLSLRKAGIL